MSGELSLFPEAPAPVVEDDEPKPKRKRDRAIRAISAADAGKGKFVCFAWNGEVGQPPVGTIEGRSLGEVLYEMLRVLRGEREF